MNTVETILLVAAIVLANFICYVMGRVDGYRDAMKILDRVLDEALDEAIDEFIAEHPELKKE